MSIIWSYAHGNIQRQKRHAICHAVIFRHAELGVKSESTSRLRPERKRGAKEMWEKIGSEMARFRNQDVRALLDKKTVIVMGDSIQRSVYKDLVCLLNQEDSRYLFDVELRAKGEHVFLGDKLLRGGKFLINSEGKMPNGTNYREVREFRKGSTVFRYYFLTRCFNDHMESILNELKTMQPDVIIMNSCLWDIHHYGPNALEEYNGNIPNLLKASENLPFDIFIWNATLPLAKQCKGGFLKPGFRSLPVEDIKKANKIAWNHVTKFGRGIYLDLYTEIQKDLASFTQAEDGIHWGMKAHRKISNLILEQIAIKWKRDIPRSPPVQFPMAENFYERYQYPLPEYHPQQEWDPMHDFEEQAPDYFNDVASMYYPGLPMLCQPNSGYPVNYRFYDHPSIFSHSSHFPSVNPHWGFLGSQNNQVQQWNFEPPMKCARYAVPFSPFGVSYHNQSFPWNAMPLTTQGQNPTLHSESYYRGRRFHSIMNKQRKPRKGGQKIPMQRTAKSEEQANSQFVFQLAKSSDGLGAEQHTSKGGSNAPTASNGDDENNNPHSDPAVSLTNTGEVGEEHGTCTGGVQHSEKGNSASTALVESSKGLESESELADKLGGVEVVPCSSEAVSSSCTVVQNTPPGITLAKGSNNTDPSGTESAGQLDEAEAVLCFSETVSIPCAAVQDSPPGIALAKGSNNADPSGTESAGQLNEGEAVPCSGEAASIPCAAVQDSPAGMALAKGSNNADPSGTESAGQLNEGEAVLCSGEAASIPCAAVQDSPAGMALAKGSNNADPSGTESAGQLNEGEAVLCSGEAASIPCAAVQDSPAGMALAKDSNNADASEMGSADQLNEAEAVLCSSEATNIPCTVVQDSPAGMALAKDSNNINPSERKLAGQLVDAGTGIRSSEAAKNSDTVLSESPASIVLVQDLEKSGSVAEQGGQSLGTESVPFSSTAIQNPGVQVNNNNNNKNNRTTAEEVDCERLDSAPAALTEAASHDGKGLKRKRLCEMEEQTVPLKVSRIDHRCKINFDGFVWTKMCYNGVSME